MKISCGALFYTYNEKNQLGIILGLERGGWLPFKGCNEVNETYEQTAIREVAEETCFLISLPNISLDHTFSSHIKIYKIGLCYVPFEFIAEFARVRQHEQREKSKEKYEVKFFPIKTIRQNFTIHPLAIKSINHYWDILHNKKKLFTYATKAIFNIPRPRLSRSASEIITKHLAKPTKTRSLSASVGKKYNKSVKFADIVKSTTVISPPGLVTLYDLRHADDTNNTDKMTPEDDNNINEINIDKPNIDNIDDAQNFNPTEDAILDQKLDELTVNFTDWMNIMENQFNEKFDKILKNKSSTTSPLNMIKSNLRVAHDNFVEMFDAHINLPTQRLFYNNKYYKENDLIEHQMLEKLVSCLTN